MLPTSFLSTLFLSNFLLPPVQMQYSFFLVLKKSAHNSIHSALCSFSNLQSTIPNLKSSMGLLVPPSFRATTIALLNLQSTIPNPQSKMVLFVPHSFFFAERMFLLNKGSMMAMKFFQSSIIHQKSSFQRLTCMPLACIISLASALAVCRGVRVYVSRLPRLSA